MLTCAPAADRLRELAWMPDYLADLEADFRVWYGVTDMLDMPGPEFFRLAMRTVAYSGVMAARAQGLIDAQDAAQAPTSGGGGSLVREPAGPAYGAREVAPDRTSIEASNVLGGLIDWEG